MAIQKIIRMGHPTLRKSAVDISDLELGSVWLLDLIDDMTDTLDAVGGIGLAAPQIDVSVRMAIVQFKGGMSRYGELPEKNLTVYINPIMDVVDPGLQGFWEGCLSVPGLRGYVERPRHIGVEYVDMNGQPQHEEFEGLAATVIQHELDHLDGILYPERMQDVRLLTFEEEYNAYVAQHKS